MTNKLFPFFLLFCALMGGCYFLNHKEDKLFVTKELVDYMHQNGINETFKKADTYKYNQDYLKALAAFENTLRKPLNSDEKHYALNQLAYINLTINEDSAAHKWIQVLENEKGPLSILASSDYNYNIGTWAYHTFKPKMSEVYLQRALSGYKAVYGEQHLRVGLCLTQLGMMFYEYAPTLDSLFKYIPIGYSVFQNAKNLRPFSGHTEFAMSINTFMHWETDNAIFHCDNALKILKNDLFIDSMLLARVLSFRGALTKTKAITETDTIQRINYFKLADSLYLKSVEILNTNQKIRKQEILKNLIKHKIGINDNVAAEMYLEELKRLNSKSYKIEFSHINLIMGYNYYRKKEVKKSIDYYRLFWNEYINDTCKHYVFLGEAAQMLFNQYNNTNNFDSASYFIKQNILINTPFWGKNLSWDEMLKEEVYGSYKHLIVSYGLAANMFLKKYNYNKDINDLKRAFQIFKITDNYLFQNIFSASDEAILSYQKEYGSEDYKVAIDIAYKLFNITKNQEYAEYGFRFSERMKAFIMFKNSNTSNHTNNDNFNNMVDSLKILKAQRERLLNYTNKEILLIQNELESKNIYQRISIINPQYLKDKNNQKISSIQSIQGYLKFDEAVVQFCVNETAFYRIIISKNNYFFNKFDSISTLQENIKLYRKYLTESDKSKTINLSNVSNKLYKNLFSNVSFKSEKINKLIIIPDKELNQIPFESLIITGGNSELSNKPQFFIDSFQIVYASSWKIYEKNLKKKNDSYKKIAVFTYDFDSNELPYSKEEVFNINKFFSKSVKLFLGKNCSKQTFLALSDSMDIIHLALHASNNSSIKQNNKIYFAPKLKDDLNGIEISALKLKTKLIILSACQTGEGKQEAGEGVYSLSRSFQLSGVSNVIATLWKIDDATTSQIFSNFYKNISLGNEPSLALHKAKKNYIQNSNYLLQHPKYWAGLIFID
jgi:CHAT domain-containing protein